MSENKLIDELAEELGIISGDARRITHKRYGVDLTFKQLKRISKVLTDYQAEKSLLEKTQDWHRHGMVAPSCVGCPTAEAVIAKDFSDDLTAAYMSGFEKSREILNDRTQKMTDAQILLNEIANGKTVTTAEAQAYFHRHYGYDAQHYQAEKAHPNDTLSHEAGMAMRVEIDGKYTRVVTEKLAEWLKMMINLDCCIECPITDTCEVHVFNNILCRRNLIAYLKGDDDE